MRSAAAEGKSIATATCSSGRPELATRWAAPSSRVQMMSRLSEGSPAARRRARSVLLWQCWLRATSSGFSGVSVCSSR
ncbi:MAG TPA: hypothetical protein VFY65_16260 [Longimicrobium sp.]|nr:hypothetical protein [Longimicrobium sp.]